MKRILAGLLLITAAGLAQQVAPPSEQTIQLSPFGMWFLCEQDLGSLQSVFCLGQPSYPAGFEPDVLLVTATQADTVAFQYTISGTLSTGESVTVSGVFDRNDNLPSVTCSYTVVFLGAIQNASIKIVEVAATATRVQSQATI